MFNSFCILISTIFRPAGLFEEPAAYCLTSFMLIILKLRLVPKIDFFIIMSFITMFLSLSLWGIISVTAILIFLYRNKFSLWFSIFLLITLTGTIAALLGITGEEFAITRRLLTIGEDGSRQQRFGELANIPFLLTTDPILWFGNGPNSKNYIYLGANALGYMLATWGIAGSLLFFGLYLADVKKENLMITVFGILLGLTAGVIWTVFFWWAWLALMIKKYSSEE